MLALCSPYLFYIGCILKCDKRYHCFQKSNLQHTRDITLKRVTSGKAHLRGLAPGQHVTTVASRWRQCRFNLLGNRTPDHLRR